MKLNNSFFLVLVLLIVSLIFYSVRQVNNFDASTPRPSYNNPANDWPVDYYRGGAGWAYPRYRDQPFYPIPNSPHPRPYPPHAPMGGRAIHIKDHGH
jgi:hypothetical protein